MDRYFCRINRSDNQDTLDVLDIEEGFSYPHHPRMAGGGCQISKNYTYCPANPRPEDSNDYNTYAAKLQWGNTNERTYSGGNTATYRNDLECYVLQTNRIKTPSIYFQLSDSNRANAAAKGRNFYYIDHGTSGYPSVKNGIALMHLGRANMGFIDGHAGAENSAQIQYRLSLTGMNTALLHDEFGNEFGN